MASTQSTRRLVGDIGGTNTRLGLFNPDSGSLSHIHHYTNSDFTALDGTISDWLQTLREPAPSLACLAVAAPPFDDTVTLLNVDWTFSASALQSKFGFERLLCINDFEGNAYALPYLLPQHYESLRGDIDNSAGLKLATIGPGTGLGGATLTFSSAGPLVSASEPGHMGLAPANPLEFELFQLLRPNGGEVFAEQLISGPGLLTLYQALGLVRDKETPLLTPTAVTAAGQHQGDNLAREALEVFCALLGSICGDYVLATGSYGGLYIAGGVAPKLLDTLRTSQFESRFSAKGAMREQLDAVPIRIVTTDIQGLLGAAHTPL